MAQFPQVAIDFAAFGLPAPQKILSKSQRLAFTFSGDVTPPVIADFLPVPGSPVARKQPITFDVTDADGFGRVMVLAKQASFEYVVHDGDAFLLGFAGSSTRLAIAGGWAYSIVPDSGWDVAPTIRIYAVDAKGNETPG